MTRTRIDLRGVRQAAALAALLALAACGKGENGQTVGQRLDSAIGRASEAAREVKQGGEQAAQDARGAVMGAAGQARQAASSAGSKADDAQITAKVNAGLAADKDLGIAQVDVDTRDGVVTLKGTAPTATAKARAAEIARAVKEVKSVDNQLVVKSG